MKLETFFKKCFDLEWRVEADGLTEQIRLSKGLPATSLFYFSFDANEDPIDEVRQALKRFEREYASWLNYNVLLETGTSNVVFERMAAVVEYREDLARLLEVLKAAEEEENENRS